MYDIIGDIHGHAYALKKLLEKLGYRKSSGAYRHSDRKAIFVGDYIDRGPQVRETLQLVRYMVDAGQAIALMGNHEFNAILFNEPDGDGGYLRPHSDKNKRQHKATLKDFAGSENEYQSYISWFKTLPLFYENDDFRAIHACWDSSLVNELQDYTDYDILKPEYFRQSGKQDTRLHELVEILLKGREVALPDGLSFKDKDGHIRNEVRIKWWLNPEDVTLDQWSFAEDIKGSSEQGFSPSDFVDTYYEKDEKPVFFGHYWLSGMPEPERSNVCCLDYSIGNEEKLAAYKYDGEEELIKNKMRWVEYRG
ncbi:MAG: metallophosphoesterase [Candidatus Halalkalibacterium sp. M3_1C_030]